MIPIGSRGSLFVSVLLQQLGHNRIESTQRALVVIRV